MIMTIAGIEMMVIVMTHLSLCKASELLLTVGSSNVTVIEGHDALLLCSVENLGIHKVVWLDQHLYPLTFEEFTVIDDSRFSLLRPYLKDWHLSIADVKWNDNGEYRCSVNTDPVRYKRIWLDVKVPAKIIDKYSSNDVTVMEGETLSLICNASGVPEPKIKLEVEGEVIVFQNISRYCSDIYECVASNGIPPSDHRQIFVSVQFRPEVTSSSTKVIATRGVSVSLHCTVLSNPVGNIYWEKDFRKIPSKDGYDTEVKVKEYYYSFDTSMTIFKLDRTDYGVYSCVAENSIGITHQQIHVINPDYSSDNSVISVTTLRPINSLIQIPGEERFNVATSRLFASGYYSSEDNKKCFSSLFACLFLCLMLINS